MKKTLIVSAYPACGKTYAFNNFPNKTLLDSDSSNFSWLYDENGEKLGRNPDFPKNYIKHIQENKDSGEVDIIFVSSHLQVREALSEAGIEYITIYPDPNEKTKAAWLERMRLRGNDENFIKFQEENWDNFVSGVMTEPHGRALIYLGPNEYISDIKFLGLKNEKDA